MAAALDKDPYTYQKERNAFLKELWQFNQSRGTSYHRIPRIGGKEVDLYLLYIKVNELGGWDKVTDCEQWEELLEFFHIPRACTNASQALKQICLRYLYVYQKVQQGDDPDMRPFENDDESSRKRKRTPHMSIPMRYNHRQHQVTDSMRHAAGLCTDTNATHEYVKLERSLLSGLPNEVDFAVNVLTLLSNEGKRSVKLATCPHVVNLLLAHIGIFDQSKPGASDGSYQRLSESSWKNTLDRNYIRFWLDSVQEKEIRDLIFPASLCENMQGGTLGPAQTPDCAVDVPECEDEGWHEAPDHSVPLCELLNLNRELGVHDTEGQRVLQLAMIIRNLSFNEDNIATLASNQAVFRFLQLCIHSKYASLRQLGLDTLGSICRKTRLDPIEYQTTQLYLRTITRCISSEDKFEVTRGLEMLANLSLVVDNGDTLSESLEQWVYEDIVSMLLVHDIQLTVHTLEALYQLSELGHVTTNHIASVKAAVGILVDLTTVEAQSYGPNSLLGIKVVEHVPPPTQLSVAPHPHHHSPHHLSTSLHNYQQGSPLRHQAQQSVLPSSRVPTPVTVHQVHAAQPSAQSTPQQGLPQTQMTAVMPHQQVATPTVPQLPLQNSPQQAPHQTEMDSETLACSWLQSHIEVSPQTVMTRNELYTDYLGTCGRLGIRDVINTNSFANCVRVTFPKVQSTRVEKVDGMAELNYRGLRRRDVPLPFPSSSNRLGIVNPTKIPQQLHSGNTVSKSSLIGQQLAGPSHAQRAPPTSLPGLQNHQQQNSPSYPVIQQALQQKGEANSPLSPTANQKQLPSSPVHQSGSSSPGLQAGPTPDSNLIKSLLANKVTANIHRTQQQQHVHQQQQLPQQQVMDQSLYRSQQVTSSQVVSGGSPLSGNQPQQTSQPTVKPCSPPALAITEGERTLQQPPSPRSKLKMTLVAKSAFAEQIINIKDRQNEPSMQCKAESQLNVQKLENLSLKTQLDVCMERVQNTYGQKLEVDVKENETDIKDVQHDNTQAALSGTTLDPYKMRLSEENTVKSEPVSNDKPNGVGGLAGANSISNTSTSQTESHANANITSSQLLMNGNTNSKSTLAQTQLQLDSSNKDVSYKPLLLESDKLLTSLEIERRKQEMSQLLDRKDHVLGMNGISVNHIGNGDCTLPEALHKGILINPDKTSGLSLNNQQFKQQMLLQQQQKWQLEQLKQQHKHQTEKVVLENGYLDNFIQEAKDCKDNIPSTLGRSVETSIVSVNNRVGVVVNNPGHNLPVKQNVVDQLTVVTEDSTSSSANMGADLCTPMEITTDETTVLVFSGGNNGTLLDDNSLSNTKAVGGLTIAEILKHKGGDSPVQPRCQSPLGVVVAGVQQGKVPILSVHQSGAMAPGIPAEGYASQLHPVLATTAVSRPSVLATSAPGNPQLVKLSTEQGNVHSPTLTNLPTPGDLASQMKSVMHQPPVVCMVPPQQTVQASALMQQLQQPTQQQPPTSVSSPTGFAAQMQQLQQRLQMSPQVNWPLTTQQVQQQQQTVPIATVAQQQAKPQVVSTGHVLQQQLSQLQQTPQPVPIQVSWPLTTQQQIEQPATVPIATVAQQQLQPEVVTTAQILQQQTSQPVPIQPSISKSQLIQRLHQPLTTSQSPILITQQHTQPHSQAGQQPHQSILLQQQGVNGAMHQVVVTSNLVTSAFSQQTQMQAVQRTLGQTVTLVHSQGAQPMQVMSTQSQPGQVVSNMGQPLQVVNTQGHPIQVIQSQAGHQIQVVAAAQGQQLIQGQIQAQTVQVAGQGVSVQPAPQPPVQQVQVMQGGLQVRAQQVQVMPGQCVQMVQGQPQVMQLQMHGGQPLVFQQQAQPQQHTVVSGNRAIQPAIGQPQLGQVKQGQLLLPRPAAQAQQHTPQPHIIVVSQAVPTGVTTHSHQTQISQPQLPTIVQQQQQPQSQLHTQTSPQVHVHTKQQPLPLAQTQLQSQVKIQTPHQHSQLHVQTQQQLSQPPTQPQPIPMDVTSSLNLPGDISSPSSSSSSSSPPSSSSSFSSSSSYYGGATSHKRPSTTTIKCEVKLNKKIRIGSADLQCSSGSSVSHTSQGLPSQPSPTLTPPSTTSGDYMCDWNGCKQCFETQKACSTHMVKFHFVDGSLDNGYCRWEACDKLKRQRWSLITHIQDRHLTEHALRTAHVKRQAVITAVTANPSVGSTARQAAAPPPVYPADAALHAIRRFAPRQPYPEFVQKQGGGGQQPTQSTPHRTTRPQIPPFEEPKEGPVTKHIRLTSGLILRNIAKFSDKGWMLLLKHEKHLSNIALSSVEASTAVSHCLWEIHNHRPDEETLPATSVISTPSEKH